MRKIMALLSLNVFWCAQGQESGQNKKEAFSALYEATHGFNIPQEEVDTINHEGGNATYGEITYDSVEKLFNDLVITKKDVLYDLGSGVGKVVVQSYLNFPFKKVVGVELSKTRHENAQKIVQKLKADGKLQRNKKISFENKNIIDAKLNDATVVFMCSLCFSDELMKQLLDNFNKSLKKGTRIISLRELPKNENFKLEKTLILPMTWSNNTRVYVYQKQK